MDGRWTAGTSRTALGAVLLAGGLSGCVACGSSDGVGGAGGASSSETTSATWSSTTYTWSSSTTSTCSDRARPSYVPEGWLEQTDYSCQCRFFVPPSEELMPAPVAWEPCPEAPEGIDCRMMSLDWGGSLGLSLANVSAAGSYVLVNCVGPEGYSLYVAAEVDGPVRSALMYPYYGLEWNDLPCLPYNDDLNLGTYVIVVRGNQPGNPELEQTTGAFGATVSTLSPTIVARGEPNVRSSFWSGPSWLAKLTDSFVLSAFRWDGSEETVLTSPALDPDHLQPLYVRVRDDAIFWTMGSFHSGTMVWDPEHGTRSFVRSEPGDYSWGACCIATDGEDLVWLQGDRDFDGWESYPNLSVWTAPYTTDPAALQPRRLRSHPDKHMSPYDVHVGCGYALEASGAQVQLVRLSDGQGWLIPDSSTQRFIKPLAVSCEEVFLLMDVMPQGSIARVRIDSLGPGTAPD